MTTIAILGAKPSSTEATAKYGVETMRSHSTPRNIYNSLRKMFPGLGAIFTRMRVHGVYTYTIRPFPDPADNGQSMLSDIRGQMVVLLSRVSFFSPFSVSDWRRRYIHSLLFRSAHRKRRSTTDLEGEILSSSCCRRTGVALVSVT